MAGKVLVFSPPGKPGEPKVEVAVLHLQPFADAPQVIFEEVPVGREAVRQLRVINPSSSEQLVKLSGPLSQKGFAADHETFVVPAKQEQTVSFTWKPDGKEPASRVVLAVTSDKGFRGRCTLLGTVKPPPARPVLKTQKQLPAAKKLPATAKILTASQRLNAMRTAPSGTKPCPKAAPPPKPTVPKEFATHSKKRLASASAGSPSKVVRATKTSCVERPCRKAVCATTKESQPRQPASEPEPVQETRRDTFDRDMAPVAAKENEEPPGDATTLDVPAESTSQTVKEDCLPSSSNEQSGAATERKVQETPA